jgi:glycerol-3-phosphate dehydrogenase
MQKSMIIIGGGIHGSAIARNAAVRGIDVTLFDKGDFGSGTSWASSKLIHGGLRYLEHAEFGLVRESLRERSVLYRQHRPNVHPLEIVIPVSRDFHRPFWQIRSGMMLYDLLSWNKELPRHRVLDRTELNALVPGLRSKKTPGGVAYFDCQCLFPERLVMANLHSAVDHGARVFNYHEVVDILTQSDNVRGVVVRDTRSGKEYEQYGDVVVNASGPWLDTVIGKHQGLPMIGGTRGSHLVIDNRLGLRVAIYTEAAADRRPFFIIPWLEFILIGTTDVVHERSPDAAAPATVEIDYLLSEFNRLFEGHPIDRRDVLFSFAGVRPLPVSSKKDAGAITRRHHIIRHRQRDGIRGLYSLIGGKLTTYRKIAEDVLNTIQHDMRWPLPSNSAPGPVLNDEILPDKNWSPQVREHLLAMYGERLNHVVAAEADWTPVGVGRRDVWAQVDYAIHHEWVVKLSDVLFRRTSLGYAKDVGLGILDAVGERVRMLTGWSDDELNRQKNDVREFIRQRLMRHLNDAENQ